MPKVLLIEPPPTNKFGNLRTLGSIGTFKADMAWPPLELMIISGYLKKNNITSEIFDGITLKASFEDIKKVIREEAPELVVFTTSTPTIYHDIKIADIVKSVSKKILTLAIGTHVMAEPEDTLKLSDNLDACCISESEPGILNLIKSGYDFKKTPGLFWRGSSTLHKNDPEPETKNLDIFGFPAHDKILLNKYFDPFTKEKPMSVTYSSRGCINQPPCIMCSACFFGKDRYRKPDCLIEEMKWLKELGVKEIRFPFESGFNNLEMASSLFKKMAAENIGLKFTCNARADRINAELIKLMVEAGCFAINIGCESADEEVMKASKKMVSLEMVRNAVKIAKKAGLQTMVYFIFGLPHETKTSIKKTFEFARSLKSDIVTFGVAIPHPGTEFHAYLKSNKLLTSKNWSEYDPASLPPYNYKNLTSSEIYNLAKKSYFSYYFSPSYITRRIRNIRSIKDLKSDFSNGIALLQRCVMKGKS